MPYIITTRRNRAETAPLTFPSRRAVATLEEGARLIYSAAGERWYSAWSYDQCLCKFPESGGAVGPLPDGTVIEVEHKTWGTLLDRIAARGQRPPCVYPRSDKDRVATIDAYNARETATA
jgi:hypothetical protein